MINWKRCYKFWHNQSISLKSSLGLGVLLLLMAGVAITAYISLRYVRIANNAIEVSTEIQRLVLKMDGEMSKARHLHGKFFLYYPRTGLNEAHEKYAQPSIRQTARVVSISRLLKDMIERPEVSNAISKSQIDVNLYLSSAKRFADTSIDSFELVTRLATPEKGLYDRLERLLGSLKTAFKDMPDLYFEMASFARQYQVTHERFLMQSAFNVAFKLRKSMAMDPSFTQMHKKKINMMLDHFQELAEESMTVDVAIHSRFNDFVLQERITGTISETLVALAEKEVVNARKIIEDTHKLTTMILLLVIVVGLITAVVISRFMTINITHRILLLTKSARAFKKGHFEFGVTPGGEDEIGQLGQTFNFMAIRIKDLVENLEKTVEQRTAALAVSENRFHELFEHASSGMAIYEAIDGGKNFVLKEINPSMEEIFNIQAADVLGKKLSEILPSMVDTGVFAVFRNVWKTGRPQEHPITSYDGSRLLFWSENKIYKLPGGDIVALCNDKTLEKQAEVQKKTMEYQLRQARKMEAIGLLAGGVAHDLNNILSPVVGYPELFLPELPQQSPLRAPLTAIHESGKKARNIVADLLTVARGVANTRENSNLNDLVKSQLDTPEAQELSTLYNEVEFRVILGLELLNISCSPVHIQKCVMNLLLNAMEAANGTAGGVVFLATSSCEINEGQAREKAIIPGHYAVLQISDSGPEISPEDLEHIFEPFYIKNVMGRSGTGLGLAVTWNIVREHGGAVDIKTGTTGTSFFIYLPVIKNEPARNKKNSTVTDDLMGEGERILVVDDDAQVRGLAKSILERFGYHPVCVSSGETALDYVKEHKVDLVLLDMLMEPGINGRQTYEGIIKIHPGQKALVASGFSESEDIEKTLQMGAGGFIKKPYTIKELAGMVKSSLAS
ncbi:PAS domain-containing protein [Desulfocicer vacuolatum DSM 3385]|uniref:histidine kinase n=1 Tax=Desulfocicer vacuolatum DSM 3385 TaxID=1121400 RepID=A0A1W1YRB5_9BACT|nr:response regulator [Desulfocicer vacuolatum]SMC38683.1 PAS domain-containing protein [Desulfocicer vacuolatum DSM 3385]